MHATHCFTGHCLFNKGRECTCECKACDPITSEHFAVAEQIAQFIMEQANEWEHIDQVHSALVDIALRIRVADWTPVARERGGA